MENIALWPANSLPPPFCMDVSAQVETCVEPDVTIDDNFPKGRILKYFPNQKHGFVKDRIGREVYFSLAEMDFVGGKGMESLKEGVVIGYDLAYAGNELRVKKMKIY